MPGDEGGWLVGDQELAEWPIVIRRELTDAGVTDERVIASLTKLIGVIAEEAINAERNRYNLALRKQGQSYNMSLEEMRESYKTIRDMVLPLLNLIGMTPFERIVSVAIEMPDGEIRVVSV